MSIRQTSDIVETPTVISVLAGTITGTNLKLANDLAAVLDAPDLRILPVVGKGSAQGALDLLSLDQIDVAFLQSNVIDFETVKAEHPDIGQHIGIIAKMFNEEVHIVAPRAMTQIEDLKGKRVNCGPRSSGGHATAKMIFEAIGVEIQTLELSQLEAPHALREGRIDALCRVVGAPVADLQDLRPDEGLHLIPIPDEALRGPYLPVRFTAEDYPGLILPERPIQTAAVASLLVTRQLPTDHLRQEAIQTFVARLEGAMSHLKSGGFHPKWTEATFDIAVPGWKPFRSLTAE